MVTSEFDSLRVYQVSKPVNKSNNTNTTTMSVHQEFSLEKMPGIVYRYMSITTSDNFKTLLDKTDVSAAVETSNFGVDDIISFANCYSEYFEIRGLLMWDDDNNPDRFIIKDVIYSGPPAHDPIIDILQMPVGGGHRDVEEYKPNEKLTVRHHFD